MCKCGRCPLELDTYCDIGVFCSRWCGIWDTYSGLGWVGGVFCVGCGFLRLRLYVAVAPPRISGLGGYGSPLAWAPGKGPTRGGRHPAVGPQVPLVVGPRSLPGVGGARCRLGLPGGLRTLAQG